MNYDIVDSSYFMIFPSDEREEDFVIFSSHYFANIYRVRIFLFTFQFIFV